ncbi:MAG TPA: acetylxylan esterase [Capsulimonadaceae bacterium]|jgi:cephalosporin-C deacetylase
MNHNLFRPYSNTCSGPQTPYLSFYSKQADDLLFQPSATGESPIEIICQAGLRGVHLTWTLHCSTVEKPFAHGAAEAIPGNRFRIVIDPQALPAGYYDLKVVLGTGYGQYGDSDTRIVEGVCTFGWRASQMAIRQTRPADFAEFWAEARRQIDAVGPDLRIETPTQEFDKEQIDRYNVEHACLPADYDPDGHVVESVESYKISIAGPGGGRIYAWVAKPLGDGPFPGMLVLPGGGFNGRPRPLEHARHGQFAVDIQIHGQDIDERITPTLPHHFSNCVYSPPEAYYYYRVHQRVIQAVTYLTSRSEVDSSRITVVGGSQGGRLGVVIAGLDDRITALVAAIPHAANFPHLAWAARCNGGTLDRSTDDETGAAGYEMSDGMDLIGAPPHESDVVAHCMAYYDPMNFALDAKCPALFNYGLIDPVSPPYSVWAAFHNLASSDKTIVALPGLGHDWSAGFDRDAWRWLQSVWDRRSA